MHRSDSVDVWGLLFSVALLKALPLAAVFGFAVAAGRYFVWSTLLFPHLSFTGKPVVPLTARAPVKKGAKKKRSRRKKPKAGTEA